MATILYDYIIAVIIVIMPLCPQAILLAMITTRKSFHGFPLRSYMGMGLCLGKGLPELHYDYTVLLIC